MNLDLNDGDLELLWRAMATWLISDDSDTVSDAQYERAKELTKVLDIARKRK